MTEALSVAKRDDQTKTNVIRSEGNVPAVVYGPKQDSVHLTVSRKEFDQLRKHVGESTIVELTGLEEPLEVLVKDVAFDPVKQVVTHVDFYAIERGKDMTVDVALELIGEAPAEKGNIGTVSKVLHELTVTCRPSNLPEQLTVDISGLAEAEDKIHVSDIKLPAGVSTDVPGDEVVAVISVHKEEEPEDAEPVDMDAVAVEAKGKDETDRRVIESTTQQDTIRRPFAIL